MARPWYAFYPADYARDTGDLSMLEHGAYRLLMDHYYSTGEPLSTDVERLLRLCRATVDAERAAICFVLDKFFVLRDDGYHHVRIDAELVKAAEKAAKCAAAGTISATKRQQTTQRDNNGRSNGRSTKESTDRQPSQSQSHISSVPSDIDPLPEWLSKEAWDGYLEMRRRIKAPMTARAMTLAIRDLESLRERGHDPTAILDQSTQNSWKGLFELKANANGNGKRTANDKFLAAAASFIGDELGRAEGGDDSDFADEIGRPLLSA